MKREDEFLRSIYEKRDAALEKRRGTVRLLKRAGIGTASLFAVAIIIFAAVFGTGMGKSTSARMDYGKEAAGEELTSTAEGRYEELSPSVSGDSEADAKPETAAPETKYAGIDGRDKETTAAFTQAVTPTGPAVEKRIVDVAEASGEENAKNDFENMLRLFGLSGESFGGHTELYGENAVEVYRMFTSNGAMYIFRYNDTYCRVADPSPSFSAADAIKLADDAINSQ
ncbi:MAG: hypothetical protein J5940_05895 [Clostridia bacterium]|nr:hypothetical protein [Clostridia bacterium]